MMQDDAKRQAPCPNPWCNSHKSMDVEIRAAETPILMPSRASSEWAVACPVCPVQTPFFDTEAEAIAAWNQRTPAPAQPADVDSGMSGPQVERAEVLWANLPTGREWTSLATHEKALACHVFSRAALAAMPVGEPVIPLRRAFSLLLAICENEPDEPIADNGMTVLDAVRQDARKLIAETVLPATPPADADAGLVAKIIHDTLENDDDSDGGGYMRAANAVLAALGQGGAR